ncbi:hypothetical protein N5C39_23840 [Enterobacter bugandensis]|uniref:DUF2913 family protein n=1 Tax=Enterobacter bugandensis TaxID=881260 RepID=A0AA42TS24_9ENTR|nr:hypothetical protein [Enterobacter bugandensis]MDH1321408.1 hypothetical protein [Enterobacter bugandensis]
MLLTDYIDSVYGTARGNRTRFLKDNPDILPQELSRWLKAGLKIRPETGEIYKPVSRRVSIPSAVAAGAGVFLSDDLRERVASLAIAQNVTTDAMLNYLWRSCTGELSEQNDLFRLTYALETAKDMSWNYRLLSDREWSGRYALALNAGVNGIYLSRTNLDVAFDDNGRQTNPLTARLTGNVAGVMKLFNRCGWQAKPESGSSLPYQYSLMARQGVSGKD